MFATTFYYLIQPNDLLLRCLDEYAKDHDTHLDDDLRRKVVWKAKKRSELMHAFHYLPLVKLAFLAERVEDTQEISEPFYVEMLHRILGEPPYTIEIFDQWWTIETLEWGAFDLEHESQAFRKSTWQSFDLTGKPAIDDWLQELQK